MHACQRLRVFGHGIASIHERYVYVCHALHSMEWTVAICVIPNKQQQQTLALLDPHIHPSVRGSAHAVEQVDHPGLLARSEH